MSAGWKLSSGDVLEPHVSEDRLWELFNREFLNASITSSYKFALIKSILDNLLNIVLIGQTYLITKRDLFTKFAECYWNLVVKYNIRQMKPTKYSQYTIIEKIFQNKLVEHPEFRELEFDELNEDDRNQIISEITNKCKRYVIGALYKDFEGTFYSFSLSKTGFDGIHLNPPAYDFLLKYKYDIQQLNYFAWAKFLEGINNSIEATNNLLSKLDASIPMRKDLSIYEKILFYEFRQNTCFYCGKRLNSIHVDHFIPWSFTKEDKIWNFVLACPSCNIKKSNKLMPRCKLTEIQLRNEKLRTLNDKVVIRDFQTYNADLMKRLWKYAIFCGFEIDQAVTNQI